MRSRCWTVGAVCAVLALGCTLLGGCSKSPFKVVQVSGKITLDGQPQPKLNVTFAPLRTSQEAQEAGLMSSATTNDEGVYELILQDGTGRTKGAVVGKHRVTVARWAPPSESDMLSPLAPDPALDQAIERMLKSTREIDVPAAGSRDLNIELKQP